MLHNMYPDYNIINYYTRITVYAAKTSIASGLLVK